MGEPAATPWHRRLAARYAAALAAGALGSALLAAVPLYLFAAGLLQQALVDRLEGTTELAALDLAGAASAARLETLREEADLDALYVADDAGHVLLAASATPVTLTPADLGALAEAAGPGADAACTAIQLDPGGEPFLSAFAPTATPGRILGARAAAPYLDRLESFRSLFAGAALAWGAGVALLGAVLGARLTRPIARLQAAAAQLAAGASPAPPEPGGAAELDALQEAFATMAAAVRQRERGLRALSGAVAHEVRNPASALRLHLGLLRRELAAGSADAAVRRVPVLEHELDLLDATVDGFLVFARDRAARRAPAALAPLLHRASDGAAVSAPDATVVVDALLLERAVANLVKNAREAGGDPVRIEATVAAGVLVVDVVDRGPGFPAELLGRAFEPFVSGREDGSGLGLAIVAAVAAAHGGEATVAESAPGRTVVRLRMPAGAAAG